MKKYGRYEKHFERFSDVSLATDRLNDNQRGMMLYRLLGAFYNYLDRSQKITQADVILVFEICLDMAQNMDPELQALWFDEGDLD